MIQSMTAFAKKQIQEEWGTLVCELRSVNHRYLEISLHLTEPLRSLEALIREQLRQKLQRGKLDCVFRYEYQAASPCALNVNTWLVQQICQAVHKIDRFLEHPAPISSLDILRWPGVLENTGTDTSIVEKAAMILLEEVSAEFIVAREREGRELTNLFLQRLERMDAHLQVIRMRLPDILQEQKNRLRQRIEEANMELAVDRLEQEMFIFMQKMDVSEEIERLETHIMEMRRILAEENVAGRRLDFLLQEFNREANTFSAKSHDAQLTHIAVELKVLIEQMREQVQNIV